MGILKSLVSFGMDCARGYASVRKQTAKATEVVDRMLSSKEKVTIEEFMRVYNLKIYDISNKQDDIKIMKSIELWGVYILYNENKKKCYVGKGKNVFRKIDRHVRGYGNAGVYADLQGGDQFYVHIIKLDDSGYENIDVLFNDISKKYRAYQTGYNKDESI